MGKSKGEDKTEGRVNSRQEGGWAASLLGRLDVSSRFDLTPFVLVPERGVPSMKPM